MDNEIGCYLIIPKLPLTGLLWDDSVLVLMYMQPSLLPYLRLAHMAHTADPGGQFVALHALQPGPAPQVWQMPLAEVFARPLQRS